MLLTSYITRFTKSTAWDFQFSGNFPLWQHLKRDPNRCCLQIWKRICFLRLVS